MAGKRVRVCRPCTCHYLRKIRHPYAAPITAAGCRLTDCRALESSAEAPLALLDTFEQMPDYSVERVAWHLLGDCT